MAFFGGEFFVEKIGECLFLLRGNLIIEPAHGCVVVVSAGVGDAVFWVVLRGVEVFGIVVGEAELEDSHAGESVLVNECVYGGSDVAEVLDDYAGPCETS